MRAFLLSASVAMLFFSSMSIHAFPGNDDIPGNEETGPRLQVVPVPVQQLPAQPQYRQLPYALYMQAAAYQGPARDNRAEGEMRRYYVENGGKW